MIENQLIFRCLASGSSGNCFYLGNHKQGILIDAGISARTIQKHLRSMGLDYANIMGVLITHDHADHIRAVGTLGERVHLPIFASRLIHEGINRNYGVQEKLRTSQRYYNVGGTGENVFVFTFTCKNGVTEEYRFAFESAVILSAKKSFGEVQIYKMEMKEHRNDLSDVDVDSLLTLE